MKASVALVLLLSTSCASQQESTAPTGTPATIAVKPECSYSVDAFDVATVRCSLRGNPGVPGLTELWRLSYLQAAASAIAAGKTHVRKVGHDLQHDVARSTTPRTCEQVVRHPVLNAVATGLQAMGDGMTNHADANCRPDYAGGYNCDVTLPPPPRAPRPPETDTVCTGGESIESIVSTTVIEQFELLTEDEAATRDDPQLPPDGRPYKASAILGQFNRPIASK